MFGRQNKIIGITWTGLLIVIAILGFIVTIIFVAFNPFSEFRDSKDARRWSEISSIVAAIKNSQIDNKGIHLSAISGMKVNEVYMITDGEVMSGCDSMNVFCNLDVVDSDNCVNLSTLVTSGYLDKIPVSPKSDGSWTSSLTGYTLQRDSADIITVRACESEEADSIWVAK